eukprot:TRINITY_DN5312_c0_g2_i8.p1 TRINITY_DN5312_c0_g2~~TRINITY_DN5312_c0_g2_i8.p1  ORF type:complete len:204 (-),score=43.77 TRINITY_DN5312_c0_g2_i8:99-710(-)
MELGASNAAIKIKLIGDSGVGKTSIINRYTKNTFTELTQATIGVDFKISSVKVGDKMVRLVIWDTAGHEKYRILTSSYYKGAHAVCMIFSISDRESFTNLDKWLKEYEENRSNHEALIMLVANKVDLPNREVTQEEALRYANKNSMLYTEVSAKTSKGIQDLFSELAHKVVEQNEDLTNCVNNLKGVELGKKTAVPGYVFSCC